MFTIAITTEMGDSLFFEAPFLHSHNKKHIEIVYSYCRELLQIIAGSAGVIEYNPQEILTVKGTIEICLPFKNIPLAIRAFSGPYFEKGEKEKGYLK